MPKRRTNETVKRAKRAAAKVTVPASDRPVGPWVRGTADFPMTGKKFEPNDWHREIVRQGVAFGINRDAICYRILNPETGRPISLPTLDKYFNEELRLGEDVTMNFVANSLYESARKGDTRAAIFLLKARRRWREEHNPEDDPLNPGGVRLGVLVVPGVASVAQFEMLAEEHRKRIAGFEQQLNSSTGEASAPPAAGDGDHD